MATKKTVQVCPQCLQPTIPLSVRSDDGTGWVMNKEHPSYRHKGGCGRKKPRRFRK